MMWPNLENLLSDNQLDELASGFSVELDQFQKNEKITAELQLLLKPLYLPLAKWIVKQSDNMLLNEAIIIGINGAQGSGKSTLCKLLVVILEKIFNKQVLHLSIDDLYLSRSERLSLANKVHSLLKVRGVPGTHNVNRGINILKQIKERSSNTIRLPVFDKSIDDLIPENKWPSIKNNINIVLFEGWCVGAKAQLNAELFEPINTLEKVNDEDRIWRTYVNEQLSNQYAELFSYINYLIMLEVPDIASVFEWRKLQEEKLFNNKLESNSHSHSHNKIMSEAELQNFLMHFERITQSCLKYMPARADVLLKINKAHQIMKVKLRV